MNLAYWCVLIAGLMPVLTILSAKLQRGYDNADPRAWLERQQGWRKRADYAHRNHFEAFPFFAAAVIVAQQVHAPQAYINLLAIIFILARIAYTLLYLANLATLRTLAFSVAYGCVLGLFLLSAVSAA
jgi:uncharacterized MAPEG superfamily protein